MQKFLALRTALEESGWSIQPIELASDCWWAKEIWKLQSDWRPTDRIIYLSFLLDPMGGYDDNRPPDTAVWAVGLSDFVPQSRPGSEPDVIQIDIKKFNSAMAEIVAVAASKRNDRLPQPSKS